MCIFLFFNNSSKGMFANIVWPPKLANIFIFYVRQCLIQNIAGKLYIAILWQSWQTWSKTKTLANIPPPSRGGLMQQTTLLHFELDDGDAVARYFEELHQRNMRIGLSMNNQRPGIDVGEYDLLRNFLLGHFSDDQRKLAAYRTLWLELERTANAGDGDMNELEDVSAF